MEINQLYSNIIISESFGFYSYHEDISLICYSTKVNFRKKNSKTLVLKKTNILCRYFFFISLFLPLRNTTRVVLTKTIIKSFENACTRNVFSIYYPSPGKSMVNQWHPPTLRTIVEVDAKKLVFRSRNTLSNLLTVCRNVIWLRATSLC